MNRITITALTAAAVLGLSVLALQGPAATAQAPSRAQPAAYKLSDDAAKKRDEATDKAWKYLETMYDKTGTKETGFIDAGWGPGSFNIAYTALVLQSLAGTKYWDATNDKFKKSVEFLVENQEASGSWSMMPASIDPKMKGQRAVYITGIVAGLLVDLNKEAAWKGKLTQKIELARDYLKASQVGNPTGPAAEFKKTDTGFGGWAYSKEELPAKIKDGKPAANMSTTIYAIDALQACGVVANDPLYKDAVVFLQRNQNAGEVQSDDYVATDKATGKKVKMASPDSPDYGGAIYSEDSSMAGSTVNDDGTITYFSYGTMSYNLLRAYLFAGLKRDDTPVKLVLGWVAKNYNLARVPGYRDEKKFNQGLYYYYVSFSRSLKVLGDDKVKDDRGNEFDWRADLIGELAKRQKADGSWVNDNKMWQENSPVLATSFALDALRNTR
ncbi:MAG: hypothetical protein IT462_00070 [Planctomycetes bacterium]|nr:hypothetical protein [Planctomycetota bacterium]